MCACNDRVFIESKVYRLIDNIYAKSNCTLAEENLKGFDQKMDVPKQLHDSKQVSTLISNSAILTHHLGHISWLNVNKESVLMEAGNSALTSSVFHGLAGNFDLCTCVLHNTRHSLLTQLSH